MNIAKQKTGRHGPPCGWGWRCGAERVREVRILLKWMKKHELFVTVVSSVIGALLGLMVRDLIKGL